MPNGRTSPKLYVPVGRPVRVELVSKDVIHGFFLPAFRVKRDVVPGMSNYAWFVATKPGSYDLFCSQYCGTGHSAMITTVEALPVKEFEEWLEHGPGGGEKESRIDGRKLAGGEGMPGMPFAGRFARRGAELQGDHGAQRSGRYQGGRAHDHGG